MNEQTPRLIDANKLERGLVWDRYSGAIMNIVHTTSVDEAPTIDAEPVRHAHWIYRKKCLPTCSLCGRANHDTRDDTPYCHCGAKMDEEANV